MKHMAQGMSLVWPMALLLTACGGSGGDSGEGNGLGPLPPPDKGYFDVVEYRADAMYSSFGVTESLLQFGGLLQEGLMVFNSAGNLTEKTCSNGGLYDLTHLDRDNDGQLSDGDALRYQFRDCYNLSLKDTLDGVIQFEFESFTASLEGFDFQQIEGEVVTSDVTFLDYGATTFSGKLLYSMTFEDRVQTTQFWTSSVMSLAINGEELMTFSNVAVNRIVDFTKALYQVTSEGLVDPLGVNGTFSFSQTQPWQGYFYEYPHEGAMALVGGEGSRIELSSNFVFDSEFLNVDSSAGGEKWYWTDVIDGEFWSVAIGDTGQYVKEYRADNFSFLSIYNSAIVNDFPINGSLELLFSREIARVSSLQAEFRSNDYPYHRVPAELRAEGAILIVTPAESLEPGVEYSVYDIEVESTQGATTYSGYIYLTVSDSVVPMVTSQSTIYRPGDTPWLSAEGSEMRDGEVIQYQWSEISEAGVVFSDPQSLTTDFTVPDGTDIELTIRLTISNELGQQGSRDIRIEPVSDVSTFLYYDSPQGDWIGGGNSELVTAADGVFTAETRDDLNYIGINLDYDGWLNLDLKAPAGEALSEKLYEGATRYPFNSPTGPGLSFSGNGRGCNSLSGEFEILDLGVNGAGEVERLAVNFIQSCEEINPALKGILRFNSPAPINPR